VTVQVWPLVPVQVTEVVAVVPATVVRPTLAVPLLLAGDGDGDGDDTVFAVNVAVIVSSAPSVVVHEPVPEQLPPDQPANVEPAAGVAVSVTAVPSG
jgi:hypothetical protein